MNYFKDKRGFTLMELLIVMSIMIILMLIAIPNFISMKAQADETSAIQSLRAIYQAQIQYQTNYPANGILKSKSFWVLQQILWYSRPPEILQNAILQAL